MDAATVEYVARLSRVDLSRQELDLFSGQLSDILDYIAQLNTLDTTGVEPLAQAVEVVNALREDKAADSLDVEEAVANAPEHIGRFYRVPAVLE